MKNRTGGDRSHSPRTRPLLLLFVTILLLVRHQGGWAQGSAGSEGGLEPRFLIDMPTAGMIDKGSLSLDIDFYQQGGVLLGLSVGVLDRLSFGVSYGGSNLIGNGSPELNPLPGVNLKVRVFEEGTFPAIAIGFDSQGRDGYLEDLDRYVIKSPGIYAALSKNYSMLGFFSIHGGVNYSFEGSDGDRGVNVYGGVEKTIGPIFSVAAEYSLGLDDNAEDAVGKGRGYLGAGFFWSIGGGLTLSVHFKDLLKNSEELSQANRTVRLEYVKAL
jgi:hypothetical protein